MSKFKVEFTLKQHTPIIHFQSEQSGATLRATELKPKFDRFLKEYAFNGKIPKEYKINDRSDALNYKIIIEVEELQKQEITKKIKKFNKWENKEELRDDGFPCFFATMGKEWKKSPKLFTYADKHIVKIISFNDKLINIIKEHFSKFLFETNFGTRQSKGFGSFSVMKIDDNDYVFDTKKYMSFNLKLSDIDTKVFSFVKYHENPDNYFKTQKKLFEVIDIFYKTLRSGINLRGKFYFKSLLYMYANSKGVVWDKKYFKQQFLGDNDSEILKQRKQHFYPKILNFSDVNKSESFLVRDLLGLSTTQEWMSYRSRIRHPKEKGEDKFKGQSIKENTIKRLKSPITIKPIRINNDEFVIYIILNNLNNNIFKEKFTIINSYDQGKGRDKKEIITKKIDNLTFWDKFSLTEYFEYINREITIKNYVEDKFIKHPYFKLIENIFTDIKASQ